MDYINYLNTLRSRLSRPLVIFDLETTTNKVKTAEIVQFAGIRIGLDDNDFLECEFRCKPKNPISEGAVEVHKITDNDVKNCKPFKDYSGLVLSLFKDADIAGYNIKRFDYPILVKEFEDCGLKFPETNIFDAYSQYQKDSPRKLANALEFYCKEFGTEYHDALFDTIATLKIVAAQTEKHNKNINELIETAETEREDAIINKWLKEKDGEWIFLFGKYRGNKVKETDVGFLNWMLKKDFPQCVKNIVKQYVK